MSLLWYSIYVAGLNLVIALSLIGFVEAVYGLIEMSEEE